MFCGLGGAVLRVSRDDEQLNWRPVPAVSLARARVCGRQLDKPKQAGTWLISGLFIRRGKANRMTRIRACAYSSSSFMVCEQTP
jgi:hypothetical protein